MILYMWTNLVWLKLKYVVVISMKRRGLKSWTRGDNVQKT